jgi:hypothetical protein
MNDLGEASFYLLESFGDGGGRTQKDGIFRHALGSHILEPINATGHSGHKRRHDQPTAERSIDGFENDPT